MKVINKYIFIFFISISLIGCKSTQSLTELDTDGDGIADIYDNCPHAAGTIALSGCPDRDGDGVPDNEDDCPDIPGPKENKGCPWADSDGDSIPDKDDLCPDTPGTTANLGCPEVGNPMQRPPLPAFPKKPPRPSDVEDIYRTYFSNCQKLGDINDIISNALNTNGYTRKSYFYVKDGFAVITQLEQTDEQGKTILGENRWTKDIYSNEGFSLSEYISALFNARVGYYRCIVIVINKEPLLFSDNSETTTDWTDSLIYDGGTYLPDAISNIPYTSQHRVTALIYQFKKSENNEEALIIRPTATPGQHLTLSGIKTTLRR
ncbi:hypothetical protein DVK85_10380 [Flavobacterium arcticum]|uniref:Thrombospondin n=1 Tax=Flavobacterium arcticum TaxID=1784713 RepID=A0A345HDF9_9FLAO|nr:hypothetical protein DVK85_10380 [Flavobacterium arcticum]KAF2512259.1 hypothetical protein E0W72_03285 [Flavobacterium arcticum]